MQVRLHRGLSVSREESERVRPITFCERRKKKTLIKDMRDKNVESKKIGTAVIQRKRRRKWKVIGAQNATINSREERREAS